MELHNIYDGIVNKIFNKNETQAKERYSICLGCSFYNPKGIVGPKCDNCGCVLEFKVRGENSKCPIGKW